MIVISALLTVCATAAEVLTLKLVSPLYVAVIECAPTVRVLVATIATPPVNVLVANATPPFLNVTVPEGVPAVAVVVAVNVTESPYVDGFNDDANVIVIFALLTVCETAAEVLALNVASPLYVAVIECAPTVNASVKNVATPEDSVLVARGVAPLKNVTVPDGVPTPLVVVAMKVTESP